jgi:glycolate oxidase
MYEKAAEIGGQVSGEHGIGYSKRDYFRLQHGDYYVELMARIKSAFDPNGILNPQKVI